ncbi:hypothetical protein NEIG_01470 [Nematocida sp. ERTm5]|nr:hypothetical protein NEIG_01470 [Nematocida sp. ERTm5]
MVLRWVIKVLLVIPGILAQIELSEIEEIQDTVIDTDKNLVINPDGPLNVLRGYIMHKSGYMHNKRLFTPEIDTFYTLENDEVSADGIKTYKYERKAVNDKAYANVCKDKGWHNYLVRFHANLIKMFPSSDGSLSIRAGRSNATTSLLESNEAQSCNRYILAAFLLLAERVNIPIIVNTEEGGKKFLVLRSANGEKDYVNLDLSLKVKKNAAEEEKKKGKPEDTYHTEIEQLVDFLKIIAKDRLLNPKIKDAVFIEPTSYDQFKTGIFLNTPQFMIQSYIYEFIDTKENYIKFIEAVYTLLNDQIDAASEKASKELKPLQNLFNQCFIDKNKLTDAKKHATTIYKYKKLVDHFKTFPFTDSAQLPVYTKVMFYDRSKPGFVKEDCIGYSNCIESTLLGLFCSMLYNPKDHCYIVKDLPETVIDLRKFFADYSSPVESVSQKMHEDWSAVVAGLPYENIIYKRKEYRNEIISGLLNILYSIEAITGRIPEITLEIAKIANLCNSRGRSQLNNQPDIDILKESLTVIFKRLSYNKNITIECEDMEVNLRTDNNIDIFGKISLVYDFNRVHNGVVLNIMQGHGKLELTKKSLNGAEEIKGMLSSIQSNYNGHNTYIGYAIKNYTVIELNDLKSAMDETIYIPKEEYLTHLKEYSNSITTSKSTKDKDSVNSPESIYKIFLWKRIDNDIYKLFLVANFAFSTVNKELSKKDAMVRFTNNIIGSAKLNNILSRVYMLAGIKFNHNLRDFYPKIKMDLMELVDSEFNSGNNNSIAISILFDGNYPEDILLKSLEFWLTIASKLLRAFNSLKYERIPKSIIKYIESNNRRDILSGIKNIIEEKLRPVPCKQSIICFSWFLSIFMYSITSDESTIKAFYDLIDYTHLNSRFTTLLPRAGYGYTQTYSFMENNKAMFCSEEDQESITKYEEVLNFICG